MLVVGVTIASLMPRSHLLRILVVAVSLGSLAAPSLAAFCPEVERCAMAGASVDGVAPACTPEMGGDCCREGEAPAGAPARDDVAPARAIALVATIAAPVAPMPVLAPDFRAADPATAARLPAAVPLYTLLATLLI